MMAAVTLAAVSTVLPPGPPAELDELTLVRARRGDERACRDLVLRYQRPVFALLSRMLTGAERAARVEDLAQETFLRVFRALPSFRSDGPARLSTWILTIASRLAVDELRRRRPVVVPLDDVATLAGPHRADAAAAHAGDRRALEEALRALDEETRAMLVMQVFHEIPVDELARVFDVAPGTIKSRLSRARTLLRERLPEAAP